ncbi:hypothetical protein [Aliikangiella maris]|uniref:Uncharacterized protein n=2 Tax=Aliikangiella maris TaxID=3162458 RepID=A0ABV3MK80_9GAMM
MQQKFNDDAWVIIKNATTELLHQFEQLATGGYSFRLSACNAALECSIYSDIQVVEITNSPVPAVPEAPVISNRSIGRLSVSWQVVELATSYDLQQRYNGGEWLLIKNKTEMTVHELTELSTGNYEFKIRACNQTEPCSAFSQITQSAVKLPKKKYIHTDILGSPILKTDEDGNVIQ